MGAAPKRWDGSRRSDRRLSSWLRRRDVRTDGTAYLGAQHRYTSAHGSFLIHKTSFPGQAGLSAAGLKALSDAATAEDQRTDANIRERTRNSR